MNDSVLWLYGSVARGQYGESSDLDVLCAVEDHAEAPPLGDLARLPQAEHLSMQTYTWHELEAMASYGSLFLLHLKMEGRPLTEGTGALRLTRLLSDLPEYRQGAKDVAGFQVALQDVRDSLSDGGDPVFELSTIATVIRHSSILACYLLGRPEFDRVQSITTAFRSLDMEEHALGALDIYQHRLAEARSITATAEPTAAAAQHWLDVAEQFIARLWRLV